MYTGGGVANSHFTPESYRIVFLERTLEIFPFQTLLDGFAGIDRR